MFEDLELASSLLNAALDRYFDACSEVRNYYLQSGSLASIPPKFTSHVSNELLSFPAFEEKLRKAKLLISWSHNCSATRSPINLLPPEILLYIFQLVIPSQQCLNHTPTGSRPHKYAPAYPDTLMHVCSRWRYIGMNSPTLWSHIDLQTDKALPSERCIIKRAETHAKRAGQLPLDVHFPIFPKQADSVIIEDLSRLLSGSTIATRARSLEIGFRGEPNSEDPILHPLSRLFENCAAGTLTRLAMYSNTVRVGGLYIDGQEKFGPSSEPTVVPLCLPKDHLNNVLLGITTLQLRLIYFPWTSPVYHGLLELRLTGYQDCISITRLQLANMLGASPQLRILEFGLHIEKESPLNTPAVPIHLMHLEALDLTMCLRVDVEFLLQWLAPGSRPLQLSLPCCHPMSAIGELASSMEPFLSRSNMATLHVMKYDFACASALIDASPKLQTLVVERVQRGLPVNKYQARAGPRELKSLYLLDSFVILEDLVKFLELWPTQTLVLWRTKFDSDSYPGGRVSSDAVLQELSRVCGDVQWVSESAPNPTKI